MTVPPPLDAESRENLEQAYRRLDMFSARLLPDWGAEIVCRDGCHGCCEQVLTLRPVEAAYLLEGARRLAVPALELVWRSLDRRGGDCALLHGGTCLAYDHRPAVCRTHGLPMLRREGARTLLHHCPLNFRGRAATEVPPRLLLDETRVALLLDAVDSRYALFAEWAGGRVPLDELLRAGLHS